MDSEFKDHRHYDLNQDDIQKLRDRYSKEMKDDPDNPIKVCMRLIFGAATEKNPDKRIEISIDLCKFLTKPDGVITLILALVDFDTSSQRVTTHNQRFTAVANIITGLPELCMQYAEYCQIIFSQLKPLLLSDSNQYSTLACIIVKSMLESKHAKDKNIENLILDPVFKAFHTEECQFKIYEAIIIINNLLQNHVHSDLFIRDFPQLFYIARTLASTPSRLKGLLKVSLITILNSLKAGVACCLLEKTLFHCYHLLENYVISAEEEEISVKYVEKQSSCIDPCTLGRDSMVIGIVKDSANELLILEFFFHFKEAILFAVGDYERNLSLFLVQTLLESEGSGEPFGLYLMNIIATNGKRSLESIARILLNYVSYFRANQGDSDIMKLSKNICVMCCSILKVLLATMRNDEEQEFVKRKCSSVLKELGELLLPQKDCDEQTRELYQDISSLNDIIAHVNKDRPSTESAKNDTKSAMKKEFDSITRDLNDKLVPVRVHAMVRLRQMIIANERYTVDQIPQLYKLTLCFLGDPEPYAFLACINLMAEMAIRETGTILPKLSELYLDGDLELQQRLNVGEVLVKLFRQLNKTTPHYAQQVMNALFTGCKDSEELVRISSLTNIGELCCNLGESLGKYLIEILNIVQSVLNTDTLEVKCAALNLLRTLLSGLHAVDVESVQRDLKSIYQLLKRLARSQRDAKFRMHLELTLDEVSRLAKEIMDVGTNEVDSLVKNIKVLSILPDR